MWTKFKSLSFVSALLACLVGMTITLLGFISRATATGEIGIAMIVAGGIYILFGKRLGVAIESQPMPWNNHLNIVSHIICFLSLAGSLLVAHDSLYRPPIYFILITISVASATIGIITSNNKKWVTILEILIISLNIRYCLYYEYPSFFGWDPWIHAATIETWLLNGHITDFIPTIGFGYIGYSGFPIMHLSIMSVQLMTLLSIRDSFFLAIGIFYVLSIIFIFLFGQKVGGTKFGLFSALLISINQFHIVWGAWLIPTTLGIGLFSLGICLTFCFEEKDRRIRIIWFLLIATLIFAHTLSSFVTLLTLGILNIPYAKIFRTEGIRISSDWILISTFGIAMLGWWIYGNYIPGLSFFDMVVGPLVTTLKGEVTFTGTPYSPSQYPLNRMGFLLLIGFNTLGSILFLSRERRNSLRVSIIAAFGMLSIMTFALPFFNIQNLITGRWIVFMAVISVPITLEGLNGVSSLLRGSIAKTIIMTLALATYSFFMINSTDVNTHTPFYGPGYAENPQRNAYTQPELAAVDTILKIWKGPITTDYLFFSLPFMYKTGPERLTILNVDTAERGIIVIRDYARTQYRAERLIDGNLDLVPSYFNKLNTTQYNKIYTDGSVDGYLPN